MNFNYNIDVLKMLWIIFWILLILGACLNLDFAIFFGIIIWYIIIFPIYQRVDIFIEGEKLFLASSLRLSLFVLLILIVLWIVVVVKLLGKFSTSSTRFEKFSKNFLRLWKLPQDLFVHIIIFRVQSVKLFVKFILKNADKHLDTDKKKIWFFFIPLFLPRIIVYGGLCYDFYEKQFIWSPLLGLLLIIPIITKTCFVILEHYANECLDEIRSYIYFERRELTKEEEEITTKVFGPGKYKISEARYRRPCKKGIEDIDINFFSDEYLEKSQYQNWCNQTKMLLSTISIYMFLVFLTFTIIIKIYEIILIY